MVFSRRYEHRFLLSSLSFFDKASFLFRSYTADTYAVTPRRGIGVYCRAGKKRGEGSGSRRKASIALVRLGFMLHPINRAQSQLNSAPKST